MSGESPEFVPNWANLTHFCLKSDLLELSVLSGEGKWGGEGTGGGGGLQMQISNNSQIVFNNRKQSTQLDALYQIAGAIRVKPELVIGLTPIRKAILSK